MNLGPPGPGSDFSFLKPKTLIFQVTNYKFVFTYQFEYVANDFSEQFLDKESKVLCY